MTEPNQARIGITEMTGSVRHSPASHTGFFWDADESLLSLIRHVGATKPGHWKILK